MVFTLCCILLSIVSFTAGQSTTEAAGSGSDWMTKHNNLVQQTKSNNASVKAVFVGDAITEGWAWSPDWGLEVWNQYYKPRGGFNYGISGDTTSNVLYRISHNEFDGLSPKVVVVMIGTNNFPLEDSVDDIASGIRAVVSALKTKMPFAKLILIGVLPRNGAEDVKVQSINFQLSTNFANTTTGVTFIDMGSHFRTSSGNLVASVYRDDMLHINANGYKLWHDQMATAFDSALNQSSMEQYLVVPDVIDAIPPNVIKIKYPSGVEVNMGNELTPTSVKDIPTLEWPVEANATYTLCMTDPDYFREFQHWLVVNIPGNQLNNSKTLTEYVGSGPPEGTGFHRYTFLVYKQPSTITPSEPFINRTSKTGRPNFRIRDFASKYSLGQPIAGNFYRAQYDDYVPTIHAQFVD